jgi:alkylation response protein AidB-like acyl-CoA dehydrogenase
VDLELNDDQVALRDGIVAMLSARVDGDRVRAGFDRALFDELASAGVFSLRADGFTWADTVVVFEQLGRFCVPGPLVGSLLAGDGTITGVTTRTRPAWVEHAGLLDALLVLDDDGLWKVGPDVIAGAESPWPLDPATPVMRVDDLPQGEWVSDAVDARRTGAVLTAALQAGLADRLTELSVAYAKERVQFDRPIGGFQAVKHILADMVTRAETARAAVYAAGAHLDAPDLAGIDRSVSVAKVVAGEAAIANGKAATQVHGGMGFTWEVDVHLYLKRAWVLDTHFGTADEHADAVAAVLQSPSAVASSSREPVPPRAQ